MSNLKHSWDTEERITDEKRRKTPKKIRQGKFEMVTIAKLKSYHPKQNVMNKQVGDKSWKTDL